jgi:eukaryotic-like serine/threonine-protein kinase
MKHRAKKKGSVAKTLLLIFVGIPVAVILLLLIANFIVMPLITRQNQQAEVPTLVGMRRAEAESALVRAGFKLGDVRTVPSSEQAPDHVVAQDPAPGRQSKPGRLVHIDVSRGANRVLVPDVAGMSLDMARRLLEETGLVVAEVEPLRMPNLPPGQVIAVRPPAGAEVDAGAPITLAVSAKVGKFPMPDLSGMDLETATGIIASQGLVLGEVKRAQSAEPSGVVMVQYPEEGMAVSEADTVRLIVSAPVPPDSQP